MRLDQIPALILIIGALIVPDAYAESSLQTLRNNPFTRPEILKPKPPPPPAPVARVVLPPEEIKLKVSATMVSATAPMAVVDGELLAIGDRIEGMKLISVMEGKVVLTRGGKKFSFEIEDDDRL